MAYRPLSDLDGPDVDQWKLTKELLKAEGVANALEDMEIQLDRVRNKKGKED